MDLSQIDFRGLILGYPMLLLALTVHECAHAWTADRLGDPTARYLGRVSLNPLAHIDLFGTVLFPIMALLWHIPLIGWAKPVPINPRHLRHPSRDSVFISLAGPVSNLALGSFLFGLLIAMRVLGLFRFDLENGMQVVAPGVIRTLVALLLNGILINVLLAIFNLIPVPPLDGSHVLEHFLPYHLRQFWEQLKPYGFFIILALFYFGILNILIRPAIHLVYFFLFLLM